MKQKQISPERKRVYYIGKGMMVVGAISFFSTFVTFAINFGDFSNFEANARSDAIRAIGGILLLIIGGILSNIGAKGLAGSGVILDPEKARKDIEPWARMGGGVVKDALDEAGIRMNESGKSGAELPFDEQLRRLHKLREDGIISDEEYQEKKKRILEK